MENIELYYESIRQVYNEILEWRKERDNRPDPLRKKITNVLIIGSVVLFILSIIPILPSLFVFLGSRLSWSIFDFKLDNATIWTYIFAWLISFVGTIFLVWISFGLDRLINPPVQNENLKPPHTLSSEQLTFIFVYQSYKELKIFFVSHIDQHIEKALDSLRELKRTTSTRSLDLGLLPTLSDFRLLQTERLYARGILEDNRYISTTIRSSLSHQIFIAREFLKTFEKYTWFHIDDLTKSRLQALISFQNKILVRLRKREDLPSVLIVLENLSNFLFASLPEHQTNMSSEELNLLLSEGTKCLDKFVENVNKLIEYPTKPHQDDLVHSTVKFTFFQKLQLLYYGNIFFRFVIWLLLLLVITTSLVYIAKLKISTLDINVMVSTVIATSVTGATALAVVGLKTQKTVQELKTKSRQLHNSIELENDEVEENQ